MTLSSENVLVQTPLADTNGVANEVSLIMDIANGYVKAQLGGAFEVADPKLLSEGHAWLFNIYQRFADLDNPVMAWHIEVNGKTGQVTPLTAEEIWDTKERALVRAEHKRGNRLARDKDGLILPYQAKIKVNAYMSNTVAFFSGSDGIPKFIETSPPFWRVATALRLRDFGKVADLGTVDVNALTGQVVSLNEEEIKKRQEQAHHAAAAAKRSTAASC